MKYVYSCGEEKGIEFHRIPKDVIREKEALRNLIEGKDLCFEEKYTELESKYYNLIDILNKIVPVINDGNFSKKDIEEIKREIIKSELYEIKDNKFENYIIV